MADEVYTLAIDAFLQKKIDILNADLYVVLVDTDHTSDRSSSGHEFLTSIVAGDRIGTAIQIPTAGRTCSGGSVGLPGPVVYGATDRTAQGFAIYSNTQDGGGAATLDSQRRLIYWNDGKCPVVASVGENSGVTTLRVEPLEDDIPSGTTFTIGGVSVTTTALASRDARSISVSSTSGAIAAGSASEASKGDGWPMSASPGGVNISFGGAPYRVFTLIR